MKQHTDNVGMKREGPVNSGSSYPLGSGTNHYTEQPIREKLEIISL